jgi:outer membrane scaffolding protein for murein synthesis (MipA/OmpV family)
MNHHSHYTLPSALRRKLSIHLRCLLSLFGLFSLITLSHAQTPSVDGPNGGESFWSSALKGAEITYGLNKTNLSIVHGVLINAKVDPALDFNLERESGFLSIENGLGVWLLKESGLKSGLSLNYMLGRLEANDSAYRGLGDVKGQFEGYAFIEWQPILEAVTLYANWGSVPGAQHKSLAQVGFTLGLPVANGWDVFWDCKEAYGDQFYLQAFYGVNAQQSQSSGKGVYLPSSAAALYNTQTLGLVYEFDAKRNLIFGTGFIKASNTLMQSPLLAGLQTQKTTLLVLNQSF